MRILVTGGAGFIGSHLVKRLLNLGHNVVVFDDLSSGKIMNLPIDEGFDRFYEFDISKALSEFPMLAHDLDYVFHLAAKAQVIPSFEEPDLYQKVNVQGTYNVLQFAKQKNAKKVIFASSSALYGGYTTSFPFDESMDPLCLSPYAFTKQIGEVLCEQFSKCFGLNTVAMRFFNVYGPGMSGSQYKPVVQSFLDSHRNGEPLKVNGDGMQSRDFTHVDDIVEGLIAAMEKETPSFDVFNLGSGFDTTILTLAQIFGDNIQYQPAVPNEPKFTRANITKALTYLDWTPRTDFFESIEQLIKTYGTKD